LETVALDAPNGGCEMKTKNTTHLAGEFLVAGELSRRNYPVSITMGNAKSVDIYVEAGNRTLIKIDAKASRSKTNWPISEKSIRDDVFYVFVYLGSDDSIRVFSPPEYYIVLGKELKANDLISTWNTRKGVRYASLNNNDYRDRWSKIPPP
jgi:hypothetical protein